MRKANRQVSGFTLIELLIVLTLISILAVIAIPTYQRIDVRTKVSLGANFIKPLRFADDSEFITGGAWPKDGETSGIPHADTLPEYVESIVLSRVDESNIVTITYSIAALGDDNTLIFYTKIEGGVTTWQCDRGSVIDDFRPDGCKS
jgi:prepilin-type N-terminal cleavage/methylation domain-containing protein